MTYIDDTNLNGAFLKIKDKSLAFKYTMIICKNMVEIDKALAPFQKATENVRKQYQDYAAKLKEDAKVDAAKQETMLRDYETKLNKEINEEGLKDSGLDRSKLTPIPAAAFEGKDVSTDEIFLLVQAGMIVE